MGGLWVETPTKDRYPVSWYALSDTKLLLELLLDKPLIPLSSQIFGLDLQPLQKIETDWINFDLGDSIWQEPQAIINCVHELTTALTTTPNVWKKLEVERQKQGLEFLNYLSFEDGDFPREDLIEEIKGIAETVMEAQRKGAGKVKLTGS